MTLRGSTSTKGMNTIHQTQQWWSHKDSKRFFSNRNRADPVPERRIQAGFSILQVDNAFTWGSASLGESGSWGRVGDQRLEPSHVRKVPGKIKRCAGFLTCHSSVLETSKSIGSAARCAVSGKVISWLHFFHLFWLQTSQRVTWCLLNHGNIIIYKDFQQPRRRWWPRLIYIQSLIPTITHNGSFSRDRQMVMISAAWLKACTRNTPKRQNTSKWSSTLISQVLPLTTGGAGWRACSSRMPTLVFLAECSYKKRGKCRYWPKWAAPQSAFCHPTIPHESTLKRENKQWLFEMREIAWL